MHRRAPARAPSGLDAECRTASAARHRLPLICGFKEMTQAGCLFSYAISLKEMWYRSATYVDKILKGAKPSQGLPPWNAPGYRSASCASRSQWAANCSQVFLCSWWAVAWANSRHDSGGAGAFNALLGELAILGRLWSQRLPPIQQTPHLRSEAQWLSPSASCWRRNSANFAQYPWTCIIHRIAAGKVISRVDPCG